MNQSRGYDGGGVTLNQAQLEEIVEHAAEKAVEKMQDAFFRELGKRSFQFLIWAGGVGTIAAFAWAQTKGLL